MALFMEVAMAVGNFLQAKSVSGRRITYARPKFGVHFPGIFSFENLRSNDHRHNLMQELVRVFSEHTRDPVKARFHRPLTAIVKKAQQVKVEQLDADIHRQNLYPSYPLCT